jgi:hypothetical protein
MEKIWKSRNELIQSVNDLKTMQKQFGNESEIIRSDVETSLIIS